MVSRSPSSELRTWFGHQPERFEEFARAYERELLEDPVRLGLADRICETALSRPVTLVYAAKDPIHNHAAVLRDWLKRRLRPETSG